MKSKQRFRQIEFDGKICYLQISTKYIYMLVNKTWFVLVKKRVGYYWSIARFYNFEGGL